MGTKYLSKNEILKATGIKYYTLDYLYKTGYIEAQTFGKGRPRRYKPDTITRIKEWKKENGINDK